MGEFWGYTINVSEEKSRETQRIKRPHVVLVEPASKAFRRPGINPDSKYDDG